MDGCISLSRGRPAMWGMMIIQRIEKWELRRWFLSMQLKNKKCNKGKNPLINYRQILIIQFPGLRVWNAKAEDLECNWVGLVWPFYRLSDEWQQCSESGKAPSKVQRASAYEGIPGGFMSVASKFTLILPSKILRRSEEMDCDTFYFGIGAKMLTA